MGAGVKNTRFVDTVTGVVLMLIAAYWFLEANRMAKVDLGIGPGGYPMFVSSILFLLGFLQILKNVIKGLPKPVGNINQKAIMRTVVFVVATIVYVWLMRYLGYLLLTPLYLFFACCWFCYRKKITAAIASIGVTAVVYFIFRIIFLVPLPRFRLF
jgi:hypothetical protein